MQLMTSRQKMDRHLQVADFSRQLKILAKDFQVPVIALSQLNRNSENSALAVPKLSDLRESGAIEQDADVVMLLRREGDYPSESLIIDVAKNRHGQIGEVDLHWDGQHSRAVEWKDTGTAGGGW
jgi:replicative DNA helicase